MRLPLLPVSLCLLLLPLLSVSARAAEQPRPFSVEDLVRLKRVTAPALAPDGSSVVFSVRETDHGTSYGMYREAEEDTYYWRIGHLLFPFFAMPPGVL